MVRKSSKETAYRGEASKSKFNLSLWYSAPCYLEEVYNYKLVGLQLVYNRVLFHCGN